MRPKNISISNAYRLTSYTFRTDDDIRYFLESKGGKVFEIFKLTRDNVGYNIILKQPINGYSRIEPKTELELKYHNKPYKGNVSYLKPFKLADINIKIDWTVHIWEYTVTSPDALNKFIKRNLGKYIHVASIEKIDSGSRLVRVIKRNTYGYRKYSNCFSLSDIEHKAYVNAHKDDLFF